MKIVASRQRGKRLRAEFDDGTSVDFGAAGGSTYVDHGDRAKRAAYIKRHRVNENWADLKSAGALARHILWGASTSLRENVRRYNARLKR